MKTIFCLIGVSGSGKSTVARSLGEGYRKLASYTTRPKRSGDVYDTDHIFVSDAEYDAIPDECKVAEAVFDGNRYCATWEQLLDSDIYIIDVAGYKRLKRHLEHSWERGWIRLVSIQLTVPEFIARERMISRDDCIGTVEKRIQYDSAAFPKTFHPDYFVDNSGSLDDTLHRIVEIIDKEQGYLTRSSLEQLLHQGYSLETCLTQFSCGHFEDGQECTIYKAPWTDANALAIVYIPSFEDNEIPLSKEHLSDEEISHVLSECFTSYDFFSEAFFNNRAAEGLLTVCDWEHPNIENLMDGVDDATAKEIFGETWEEMQNR